MVGSALTGALFMLFGCSLRAPHGGVFVLATLNAVGNLMLYIAAIVAGTLAAAAMLVLLKKLIVEAGVRTEVPDVPNGAAMKRG